MKLLIKTIIILISIIFSLNSCNEDIKTPENSTPASQQNDKNIKKNTDLADPVENNKKNNNINSEKKPPEKFEDLFPK